MENTWNKEQKEKRLSQIKEYEKHPFCCQECGGPLTYKQHKRGSHFCSQRCNGINGRDRAKKRRIQKPKCLFCGNETRLTSSMFCSFKCKIDYDWKKKIENAIKSGFAPAHQTMAKRLILRMYKHACSICEGHEWFGNSIPLVLDHINGNHEDWRLNNLRLVCGNCDMLLPTYKSKNKNKGRKYRREYYHKTKR